MRRKELERSHGETVLYKLKKLLRDVLQGLNVVSVSE